MELYTIKNTAIVLNHVNMVSLVDEITFPNGIKQDARVYIDTNNSKYSFSMDTQEIAKVVYDTICLLIKGIE